MDESTRTTPSAVKPLQETILALLPFPEPKEIFDRIRKRYPGCKIIYNQPELSDIRSVEDYWTRDVEVAAENYQQATIILTLKTLPLPEQAPNLRLVHIFSAGIDYITSHPIYTSTTVPLITSSGIHTPQIAEHVFGTLIALTHRLPRMLSWQRSRTWGSHASDGGYFGTVHDLVGKTFGILGYGAIGRQAGRVAAALGMRVLAFTATPRLTAESRREKGYRVPGTGDPEGATPEAWFSGLDPVSRRAFLEQGIDVLMISVPLTPETHHMIGKEELAILERPRNGGKGAYVINIARGPIIDQDALVESLKRGLDTESESGLAGASIDVTDPEPLGSDSELWGLENVVLTPHVAGVGSSYKERSLEIFEMNLEKMERGEPLINEVIRDRGY